MPYKTPAMSVDEVRSRLDYDPSTGVLRWKVAISNVKAGDEAGCVKALRVTKAGAERRYRYIRIGQDVLAARIAWAIHYGEWPLSKLLFIDGDTLNLRISNLKEANSLLRRFDHSDPEQRKEYLREHRRTHPKAWKDSDLRRSFGINLADYQRMFVEQKGVCAICSKPETDTRNGKTKWLAVDHCHDTKDVRGLLCGSCNKMLGYARDSVGTLTRAIRYLQSQSLASSSDGNVIAMPKKEAQ